MKTLSFKEYLKQKLTEEEIEEIRKQAKKEVRQMADKMTELEKKKVLLGLRITKQKDRIKEVFDVGVLCFEFLKEENKDLFYSFEPTEEEEMILDDEIRSDIKILNIMIVQAKCAKEAQQIMWSEIGTKVELLNQLKDHIKNGCAEKACFENNGLPVISTECLKSHGTTREGLRKACSDIHIYFEKESKDPNSVIGIKRVDTD